MSDDRKKFLFDKNDFSEEAMQAEREQAKQEAARDVFYQDDIDRARKSGFEEGRQAGLAEEKKNRENQVLKILQNINGKAVSLLGQEDARNLEFSHDAVRLAVVSFEKLYPTLQKSHGLQEIVDVLSKIIESQLGEAALTVYVHPDQEISVREYLKKMSVQQTESAPITVQIDQSLSLADCRVTWKDGGAHRNTHELAETLTEILHDAITEEQRNREALELLGNVEDTATEVQKAPSAGQDDPGET